MQDELKPGDIISFDTQETETQPQIENTGLEIGGMYNENFYNFLQSSEEEEVELSLSDQLLQVGDMTTIQNKGETKSIQGLSSMFGSDTYGFTFDKGTHGLDDYIKVYAPNNPDGSVDPDDFYTLEVDVDAVEADENFYNMKQWMSTQEGLKSPISKEDKKDIYNDAELNLYKISQYDEEEFANWASTILPNQAVNVDDGSILTQPTGELAFINIPGEGRVTIDLQPSDTDIEKIFLGDNVTLVKQKIQKIIDFAKQRHENALPTVVYNEFAPDIEGQISQDKIKYLNNQYKNLDISIDENYNVYKGEEEIFNLSQARIDNNLVGKTPFEQPLYLLADFMYDYSKNFTDEDHEKLQTSRLATIANVEDNSNRTSVEKILQHDISSDKISGYQSIALASNLFEETELRELDDKNELEIQELQNILSKSIKVLTQERDSLVNRATKDGINSLEWDPIAYTYTVGINNEGEVSNEELARQSDIINKYAQEFGEWGYKVKSLEQAETASLNEKYAIRTDIQNKSEELEARGIALTKDYSARRKLSKGAQKSWKDLIYSTAALFGSTRAREKYNALNESYSRIYPTLTWDEALEEGKGWQYAGQTIAENNATVVLAIGTAGVGTSVGISTRGAQWLIAGQAAAQGGGQKQIELANIADTVEDYEEALEKIEEKYQKGEILQKDYFKIKGQLESYIIDNDLEPWQHFTAVGGSLLAEGLFTRYIGASNFTKFTKNIKTPLHNKKNLLFRSNGKATFDGAVTFTGQTLKEITEEELIYLSSVAIDYGILDRNITLDQIGEGVTKVAIDAAIISGPMNGSGTFYSTAMTQAATAPFRKQYNENELNAQNELDKLTKLDKKDPNYKTRSLVIKNNIKKYKQNNINLTSDLELKVMSLTGKDLQTVISAGILMENLLNKAGVDPTLSQEQQNKRINKYIEGLDSKEAKSFKEQFNEALQAKEVALSTGKDFKTTIEDVYGDRGIKEFDKLKKKLKNASDKEIAIQVHNNFKKRFTNLQIQAGKSLIENQVDENGKKLGVKGREKIIDRLVYGENGFEGSKTKGGKKRTKRDRLAENSILKFIGEGSLVEDTKGFIISKEDSRNADNMLQDQRLDDLKLSQVETIKELKEKVREAYESIAQREIDDIINADEDIKNSIIARYDSKATDLIDAINSTKTNGAIIGGQYIVTGNKLKAAQDARSQGKILADVVVSHELSHGLDYLAFDEAGVTNYGKKLQSYMKSNFPDIHQKARAIQGKIGNLDLDDNGNDVFNNGESTYYDEYSKTVQDIFRRKAYNINNKDVQKLFKLTPSKISSLLGGNFEINSDKDAAMYLSSFLQGFLKGEVGNLQKRRIDYRRKKGLTRTDTDTRESSNLQEMLDTEYDGNVKKMGRDAISVDPNGKRLQGKQAFDLLNSRLGKDIGPMVTDITKRLYDPILDKGDLTKQEYQNALISVASEIIRTENFDPTKQSLDKFVSSRLYLRANALAKNLGVPQQFLKNIDDIQAPSIEPDEDTDIVLEEGRTLSDFDIALEDGIVDAEIIAEVDALIEQNPDNLQERMEKLILTDIRKKLDNAIGKIAKNPKTGKREPTAEYESFIRAEFDEIIKSLGINTVRSAYKPFFKQEKTGRKDYKNINEETGKVSNYRKDTFINTASKPDFIKYFLVGNERNLTERRTALLRRIARAKVEVAVDNYIARNSNSIDAVLLAKLRQNSRLAKNVEIEEKSFDTVKYQKAIESEYLDILNRGNNGKPLKIDKKGRYVGYVNPHNGKTQIFLDKGRIWEQAYANYFIKMNLPGLQVLSEMATEEGGMADFVFRYGENVEQHELKAGLIGPFMGSVLISEYNAETGEITLANNIHNNLISDKVKKAIAKSYKEKIDILNDAIRKGKQSGKYDDSVKYLTGNIVKGKPEYAPNDLFGLFTKSLHIEQRNDLQPTKNHYKEKGTTSITFIGTKDGNLSFKLSDDSILDLPMAEGKSLVDYTFRNTTSFSKEKSIKKGIGNVKMRKLSLGLQFKITELSNVDQALDITKEGDLRNALPALPIKTEKDLDAVKLSKVISNARPAVKYSTNPRGMSTFDFDETLIIDGENFVVAKKDGETVKISSGDWPLQGPRYAEEGYEFDFSDFVNVRGGVDGPLLQKMKNQISKFGPENVFVLTARPQSSDIAIHEWLKSKGVNIPLKNVTGLGNSTGEAKAVWMLDKFAEGYNDMYFVDDALPNVEAVKNALEQLDIKSKVVQAKVKFSNNMDADFNQVLEDVTGIDANKRFSQMKARKRGEKKGRFRFFIPPSHEDFVGLLYNFMGKGRQGDGHRDFFEKALIKPLNRAYRELNTARQSIANDYKALNKKFPDVKSKLTKKTKDGDFTFDDAVRVYLWNKHGYDIPGLSKTDENNLVDIVKSDKELQTYAESINLISKQETYVDPTESWDAGNIKTDLNDATGRIGREQFFTEFNENVDIIFSQENLNKIEAAFGASMVSAIKDMVYRIKTGQNRPTGQSKMVNQWMNYLNGSVASTMFFNIRSAVLQQMSLVNFINYADNNIYAAAKAFANQKQYYADWAFLFNSDFMKQRRGGIMTDVNGAELAASVEGAKNPAQAIIKKLLQLGFLPTQIGDNIAIATGGATFYRNRINSYLKQGLSKAEAESRAFEDFQELAEATQQSARPDMVSQQQASPLGKIILAFQNVTSQFNRLGKKAFLDLKNRRITPGNQTQFQSDVSNISRIAYYFAIQNLVFYALQSALFAAMFGDEEDDEQFLKKQERMINGTLDSVLRGTGVMGAAVATLKNMAIKWFEQREPKYNKDESAVLMEMLNVSPPLGIKARKLVNAEKTLNYNTGVIQEMEMFDADNPQWSAATNYIEALTNVPVNRLYNKTINVRDALDSQHNAMQRALMFSGWSKWNLGIQDAKIQEVRETVKEKKKQAKKKKKFSEPVQHKSRSTSDDVIIIKGR
tara:strand:+ start:957 stop:9752 length:8796 start_codon:yes stop_codon:yes gene_type:complete